MSSGVVGRIEPIVEGVLYRLGVSVPVDGLTWIPEGAAGFDPQNAYLFLASDEAVFIDTGPAIARPAIEEALSGMVGTRRVSVFPTRNEAEAIGNLGLLLAHGRDARLLFGGGGGILEWVPDPDVDELEPSNMLDRVPIEPAGNGTSREVGSLHFEWLDAPVKQMFLTQWAYESSTRSVFTSDFFSWVHQPASSSPAVVASAPPRPAAQLAAEIACRVNWLPGAHCPEVLESFERFFAEHDVEVIAPDHGCVLSGRDVVKSEVAAALDALRLLTV